MEPDLFHLPIALILVTGFWSLVSFLLKGKPKKF
jgi:hypothetical protein